MAELLNPNRDCYDVFTKEGRGLTAEATAELLAMYQAVQDGGQK